MDDLGIQRFVGAMCDKNQSDCKKLIGDSPVDVGEILPGFALKTTQVAVTIPRSDYRICRTLTIVDENFRGLSVGDSVLVNWVGSTAVVVDVVS